MIENGDQVVGVLRPCDACDRKTVHIDGVCREHREVARAQADNGRARHGLVVGGIGVATALIALGLSISARVALGDARRELADIRNIADRCYLQSAGEALESRISSVRSRVDNLESKVGN